MPARGSTVGFPNRPRRPAAAPAMLTFSARSEPRPGEQWRERFLTQREVYRTWYLGGGEAARPPLDVCDAKLAQFMPELVGIHRELVELAGGDEIDARMLSLYDPPPFITGCSQAAWVRGTPVLVRNYDYPISRLEGMLVQTEWRRRVIGMSDCMWGLLDGVNDAGLAVSLTFGGRTATGEGFAIPLVVRYMLETCTSVTEACDALARIPVHASQNITLVDSTGDYMTAYVAPDRPLRLVKTPVTTNHQGTVEWPEYEQAVHSVERESCLLSLIGDPTMTAERLLDAFLQEPVHSSGHRSGTGTLYTASYYPGDGRMEMRWPSGERWTESFDAFVALDHTEIYDAPADYARAA
ncbi:MAG TPA: C45 family peptidase [Solirubrobacteraceae bacterium]|nr:C45 family peptidase [Solirubrobacteraceae bacterium]